MKIIKLSVVIFLLLFSTGANAVVINTINGINYEWLELTETQGYSRDLVEFWMKEPGSPFYGYQYASRALIEDLFLSYVDWDGQWGWYGSQEVVSNMSQMLLDFGVTEMYPGTGIENTTTTVDGFIVNDATAEGFTGLYGLEGECINYQYDTCTARITVASDIDGNPTMAYIDPRAGWDDENAFVYTGYSGIPRPEVGSFIYRTEVTAVPLPQSLMLMGSGLLGLFGAARRK